MLSKTCEVMTSSFTHWMARSLKAKAVFCHSCLPKVSPTALCTRCTCLMNNWKNNCSPYSFSSPTSSQPHWTAMYRPSIDQPCILLPSWGFTFQLLSSSLLSSQDADMGHPLSSLLVLLCSMPSTVIEDSHTSVVVKFMTSWFHLTSS